MIHRTQISRLAKTIAIRFQPEKIILFGSYAYGTPTEDSDVDLLVIMPFEGKPFHKAVDVTVAVHPGFAVDIVVARPEDAERRYQQGDPLIGDALDFGKVLYARSG